MQATNIAARYPTSAEMRCQPPLEEEARTQRRQRTNAPRRPATDVQLFIQIAKASKRDWKNGYSDAGAPWSLACVPKQLMKRRRSYPEAALYPAASDNKGHAQTIGIAQRKQPGDIALSKMCVSNYDGRLRPFIRKVR